MTQTANSTTGPGRRLALCTAAAALLLLALAPGAGAKVVIDAYAPAGPSPNGTQGGLLIRQPSSQTIIPSGTSAASPNGIAVNISGNGAPAGAVYLADGWGNRIQRFDSAGAFQRAWGENVLGRDEHQTIAFGGLTSSSTGGTFTLSFDGFTTAPIAVDTLGNGELHPPLSAPSPGSIREALVKLPSIGPGGVTVAPLAGIFDGSFVVRFTGAHSGADVSQLTANGAGITGPPLTIETATLEQGSGGSFAGPEICTVAAQCQNATAAAFSGNGGQLDTPNGIAIDQSSGDVYVAEDGRISKFDADGNFLRAFGWDVVSPGAAGDVPGVNEQQTVTLGANTTGGKFSLRLGFSGDTTGAEGTATRTNGSKVLQEVQLTSGGPFEVGQTVTGQAIPANTTITAIDLNARTLTLSNAATANGNVTLAVHDIPWDASPAQVQAELEDLEGIGAGNVAVSSANPGGGVTGGPYTVTFQGDLADVDVSQLTGSADGLTVSSGSRSVSIATTVTGRGNFEVCAVAADCKQGVAGANGGQLGFSRSLAIDAAGHLWVADASNRRIEEFDSSGNFLAAYGWDVDALGGGGGLEKCTSTAAGACQAGSAGSGSGQFGSGSPSSLAFDSSGNLYAVDSSNKRVQKFDPAMSAASDFAAASFSEAVPQQVVATAGGNRLAFSVTSEGERRILELDAADGSLEETSLAGAGLTSTEALGYDPAGPGRIYLTTSATAFGARGVLVLDEGPVAPPLATIDPITVFDDESATFTGGVDPDGLPLGQCVFQYSTDQASWIDAPATPDCASFDRDGGAQPVSVEVDGLESGAHYYVRLLARRPYNPAAQVLTAEEEFTTPALAPLVSSVGAVQVTDTSAYLTGVVQPRSQTAHYTFQYTTTDFQDCGLPANPGCLEGAEVELKGAAQRVIAQQVTGLTPGAEYELKLIVSNEVDTVESGIASFQTRAEPLPNPDQRGYEQVSPTSKNFNDIGDAQVAADGQAATVPTVTSLDDPAQQTWWTFTRYLSRRHADGWRVQAPNPPNCAVDPDGNYFVLGGESLLSAVYSDDLTRAVLIRREAEGCPLAPLDPAAPHQENLYLTDFSQDPAYQLLTPQPVFGSTVFNDLVGNFAGSNEAFDQIVYASIYQMTADAPAGDFDKLFSWQGGSLQLISKDTGNVPFATASAIAGRNAVNTVSENGLRIFFHNPVSGPAQELYMRQAGAITTDVSQSECTVTCGASAADVFRAATPTGNKAIFTSAAKLNNEDTSTTGADLYLYTHSAKPAVNTNLTLLSKDAQPADGTKADVQGVLGMSDDAGTVFFAASGQIVAGGPTAAGPKLYRWRANGGSPTVDYLATLAPDAAQNKDSDNWSGKVRRVSPDGSALLIQTRFKIDPLADTDADLDVYHWAQESGWECASCQRPDLASSGDSNFSKVGPDTSIGHEFGNAMSADGERVYFSTSDALLSADTNGKSDVYEWRQGALSLISSGASAQDVILAGASLSGEDVFFLTRERLVGWDTDESLDLYDARIGGGFPEPPPTGAPCDASSGACEGAGTVAPPTLGAGTAAFEGPGNRPLVTGEGPKRCPKGKRKVRRKGKARCVKRANRNRAANRDRRTRR